MSYNKLKTDFQVAIAKWLARRSLPALMRFGRILGRLLYYLPHARKRVAQTNLSICYPDLSARESQSLLKDNMISTGQGLMELLATFWAEESSLVDRFQIDKLVCATRFLACGK